jgi:AmmeMemoRadiSam system protein B
MAGAGKYEGVRAPICADDQWYPSRAEQLQETVDRFLAEAPPPPKNGRLVGLISPHAGYRFSGRVAGAAYRLARDSRPHDYETVVLVGPVHRMYASSFAVTAVAAYGTPLGEIPLDQEMLEALDNLLGFVRLTHDNEHSLEVQLPFLQRALGDFALVPIMMGDQSPQSCRLLGDGIAQVVGEKKTLLVASTDLSHFHDYDTAKRLDEEVLKFIEAYDEEGLAQALAKRRVEACGGGPVVAVMRAARTLGADRATVVKYANSGDVWPDRSSVVGYAAVAITAPA